MRIRNLVAGLSTTLVGPTLAVVFLTACGDGVAGPEPATPSANPVAASLAEAARAEDQRQTAPLVEATTSTEETVRLRAVQALGRVQDPAGAEALIAALQDTQKVRDGALYALGQIGLAAGVEIPRTAVKPLVQAVQGDDPEVAALAAEALGKLAPELSAKKAAEDASDLDPDASAALLGALSHPDARVRRKAAMAMFRWRFAPSWRGEDLRELSDDARDALVAAMDDENAEVRRAAVYAFTRDAQPEAADALAARLGDDDEWVRLWALRALRRAEAKEHVDAVLAQIQDDSPRVRSEAVETVIALGASDELQGLESDPSLHVRAAVARSWGSPERQTRKPEALISYEHDESPTVRIAALGARIARNPEGARESFDQMRKDDSWVLRAAAIRHAGAFDDSAELFREAWKDPDHRVRVAALETFGRGDAEMFAEALAADDLALRGTAVLELRGAEEPEAVDLLLKAWQSSSGEEWIEIREAIANVSASLPGESPAAQDLLRRIAKEDEAGSVRTQAVLALRAQGVEVEASLGSIEPSPFLGQTIEGNPLVELETSKGTMILKTLPEAAPLHVASFLERVKEGFYDGLIWHRVVPNFVIQGGDPRGDGWGGPGYVLRDEISTETYDRGVVGMPKAGKDTGGCQIFITHVPTPRLDGRYTIFAVVEEGLDVIDEIEVGDKILRASVL